MTPPGPPAHRVHCARCTPCPRCAVPPPPPTRCVRKLEPRHRPLLESRDRSAQRLKMLGFEFDVMDRAPTGAELERSLATLKAYK